MGVQPQRNISIRGGHESALMNPPAHCADVAPVLVLGFQGARQYRVRIQFFLRSNCFRAILRVNPAQTQRLRHAVDRDHVRRDSIVHFV